MKRRHLVLAAAFGALAACSARTPDASKSSNCATRAYDNIGGAFELTDQNGNRVTEANFKGRPSLVYFGFTYCPDICPGTLVAVGNALKQLPDDIETPQTILISVDPERDTPEALKAYIEAPAFPDDIHGLTGTPEQIRAAADVFFADYSRIETPESAGEYTMDHTSLLYLMDENWTLKTFFSEDIWNPQAMATCLEKALS